MVGRSSADSTYYEILEVSPTASGRDIYAAYLRAKETYSPDSPALYTMFSAEEARELLRLIEEAYSTLSQQARRDSYDESLARRGVPGFTLKPDDQQNSLSKSGWAPATSHQSSAPLSTPDHPAPNLVGEEGARVKPAKANGGSDLPAGFAKTRFGLYEIDSSLEEEISQLETCSGAMLKKIRQYKKVSLEQLCDATRISKSTLAALETDAFDALPAAVYVRGFVSQWARALGLNDRQLCDAYMKHYRANHSA